MLNGEVNGGPEDRATSDAWERLKEIGDDASLMLSQVVPVRDGDALLVGLSRPWNSAECDAVSARLRRHLGIERLNVGSTTSDVPFVAVLRKDAPSAGDDQIRSWQAETLRRIRAMAVGARETPHGTLLCDDVLAVFER